MIGHVAHHGQGVFLAAALVVIAALAGLLLIHPRPPQPPTSVRAVDTPRASLSGIRSRRLPRLRPRPPNAPSLGAAGRAARRFLASYLPVLYGHRHRRRVIAASPHLRHALRRDRVRVSPATRRRHPHIRSLRAQLLGPRRALVQARVWDGGPASWPIELQLDRAGSGWRVVRMGDD